MKLFQSALSAALLLLVFSLEMPAQSRGPRSGPQSMMKVTIGEDRSITVTPLGTDSDPATEALSPVDRSIATGSGPVSVSCRSIETGVSSRVAATKSLRAMLPQQPANTTGAWEGPSLLSSFDPSIVHGSGIEPASNAKEAQGPRKGAMPMAGYANLTLGLSGPYDNDYDFNSTTHQLSIDVCLNNTGSISSGFFSVGFMLSDDKIITKSDYVAGILRIGSIPAWSSVPGNIMIPLDNVTPRIPAGTYYIGIMIDYYDEVYESPESDNIFNFTTPIYYPGGTPNLAIYKGSGSDSHYHYIPETHVLDVTLAVCNSGTAAAQRFRIGWYLSTDEYASRSNDLLVATQFVDGLNPATYTNATSGVDLDSYGNLPVRSYYLTVYIDDIDLVDESDGTDNDGYYATPFTFEGASNLYVYMNGTPPNHFSYNNVTHQLTCENNIGNKGDGPSETFRVGWYLSTTQHTYDYLLGTDSYSGLNAAHYVSLTMSVDLDDVFPRIPQGEYYISVYADDLKQLHEVDDDDNSAFFTNAIQYTFGRAYLNTSSSLVFDQVAPWGNSQRTLTLSNTGSAPLVVNSVSVSSPTFNCNPSLPLTIMPGGYENVVVSFSPQAQGSFTGSLTINSNAENNPVMVGLQGVCVVTAPHVSVTPSPLECGSMLLNSTSDKMLTISNTGNAVLNIHSATILGTAADDYKMPNQPPPTVAANGTGYIYIRFTPKAEGQRTAILRISCNDPATPTVDVPLNGTGTVVPKPRLVVDRRTIDFGLVEDGASSADADLLLTNAGTATLSINSADLSNGVFHSRSAAPYTIGAGSSQIVKFYFTPTGPGTYSGTLTITSNDENKTEIVTLSGRCTTAGKARLEITPNPIVLDKVPTGDKRDVSVTIKNIGAATAELNEAVITGVDASSIIVLLPPAQKTLAPGASTTCTIRVYGLKDGIRSAKLVIHSNDPGSPTEVPIMAIVTDVPPATTVPSAISLNQNYPNPVTTSATVQYTLPAAAKVSLRIYNNAGTLVATVFEGHAEAGIHSVRVDASALTPGNYYYVLESGSRSAARSMQIIR